MVVCRGFSPRIEFPHDFAGKQYSINQTAIVLMQQVIKIRTKLPLHACVHYKADAIRALSSPFFPPNIRGVRSHSLFNKPSAPFRLIFFGRIGLYRKLCNANLLICKSLPTMQTQTRGLPQFKLRTDQTTPTPTPTPMPTPTSVERTTIGVPSF